jgi:outer membrane receptor protein involved in Fe transport
VRAPLLASAAALALLSVSSPVWAGEAVSTASVETAAAESADRATETVIVTARKRQERAQDVPLSIGVINAAEVEAKRITDIDRVANLTPGLTFDVGLLPTDTRIAIRGLQAVRGRPNVAILVDGIDTSSENFGVAGGGILANLRLVDVERVEVVKGPQNVLYGRSAFAGAVNYITKRPTDTLSGTASVELGTYGLSQIKGSISGPITQALSARLNLVAYSTEGDHENSVTGGRLNAAESVGGALSFLYAPNDDLSAYLRVQYSKEEYSQRAAVLIRSVDPTTGLPLTENNGVQLPDRRPTAPFPIRVYSITGDLSQTRYFQDGRISLSPDPNNGGRDYEGSDIETFRASFSIDWKTPWGDLELLTGYTDNESIFNEDFDHSNYSLLTNTGIPGYAAGGPFSTLSIFRNQFGWPLPFLPAYGLSGEFDATVTIEQISQEVRWTKDFGRVRATLDALYWHENAEYRDRSIFWLRNGGNPTLGVFLSFAQRGNGTHLAAPPVTSANPQRITRETDSLSLAGQLSIKVTDALTVDLEARAIKDEIVYTGLNFEPFLVNTYGVRPGGFVKTDPPVENDKFTPRVNVGYKVSDGLLLYASYAQGTKPGGVDTTDQNGNVNDGRFLPEKVVTYEAGAKFVSPTRRFSANVAAFSNIYTDQQIGIIETINGVPGSRTVNIGESESKGFEIEADWNPLAGLYLRAAYTYVDAKFTDYVLPRCGPVDSAETNTPNCNFTGKAAPLTPEHKVNLGLRYERPVGDGANAVIDVDTRYESLRYVSTSNLAWLPEYWHTDLRMAYEGEKWTAEFFVNNLFEDKSPRTGSSTVDYGYFDLNSNQLPRGYLIALPPSRTAGFRLSRVF